ncbi:hypothetical protein ACLOAV_005421 [Pseudogymnoascus australis]
MKLSYALTLALQLLTVDALTVPTSSHPGVPGVPKTRPRINVGPKTLKTKLPKVSPPRHKTCHVKGGTSDDSAALLKSFHECNNGGHVVLDAGVTYTIGTVLDLTFLNHVDWDIQGTLTFTTDTDYWQANSLKYKFQDSSAFFAIGGKDVNIFGGGVIDGKGQVWYDLFVKEPTAKRPLLFVIDGLEGGTMSNLNQVNPPNWFNLVANSTNVVIDNMDLKVAAVGNAAKNTDGWDTYRSSNVVIQNSIIDNTDDCVSFKPNSTQILVQNLRCNGSHGISVGSLGQYVGVVDIVEDILVYNTSMTNAGDGARIKVFPGAPDNVTMNSGGGSGYVKNVVYDKYDVGNVDWPIEVTGCYTVKNAAACAARPPKFHISDVLFKDFTGVSSKKYEPYIATVACPSLEACENIRTENFQVKTPKGKSEAKCSNINEEELGLDCTAAA